MPAVPAVPVARTLALATPHGLGVSSASRPRVPLVVLAVLVALVSVTACAACDQDGPPSPSRGGEPGARGERPPVRGPSVAKFLGVDASELEPRIDPPAPVGDLQADIAGFTTVDACVEQHAHIDPLLGDALSAIGYDTFVRDACRMLEAAKTKDKGRCASIDASSLRDRCEVMVAVVAGDADACPWELPAHPEEGRDPRCVAWASRDPRLCAACAAEERDTCEAALRHDSSPCMKLPGRGDQKRCRRDAERWSAVVVAPKSEKEAAELPAAEWTVHVDGAGAGAAAGIRANLSADLARGIVLRESRDGVRFTLGSLGSTPSFVAASPHTDVKLGTEIFASADGKRTSVERIQLSVPGHSPIATPLARSSIAAKVTFDRPGAASRPAVPGSAVEVSLEGDIGDATGSFHVSAKATTFVRDVVTGRAIYGTNLP